MSETDTNTDSGADRCPATNRNGEQCGLSAGWGLPDTSEGPCKFHGGAGGDVGDPGGAPEGSANAQKHALRADRGLFYDRLEDSKQARVDRFEAAMIDRYKRNHGRDPDPADVKDLFEIAVGYALRDYARDYMAEEMAETDNPMLEHVEYNTDAGEHVEYDKPAEILEQIETLRQGDRMQRKTKGLENDPESQNADAVRGLTDLFAETDSVAESE